MPDEVKFGEWFGRCDASLMAQRDAVTRTMEAISKQLDHGHISDKAVADSLLGMLNQAHAAILGTQDAVEEFRGACEQAGMLPPRNGGGG